MARKYSHPYSDACICAECTERFNKVFFRQLDKGEKEDRKLRAELARIRESLRDLDKRRAKLVQREAQIKQQLGGR